MGEQLLVYYEKANAKGGIQAKVKMAMMTKMSSEQAKSAPDTPENIKLFTDALAQL